MYLLSASYNIFEIASNLVVKVSEWSLSLDDVLACDIFSDLQMLPFLAASGHNNDVKSLVLYLAKMERLELSHPSVYNRFMEGLFDVRRSDSYWSGIFSDLYIEQVLMGSITYVGGLTRGRGFDNSNSLVWLLFTPACGEVHKAIQEVASL